MFVEESTAIPIGSVPAVTPVTCWVQPPALPALQVFPLITDTVPDVPLPTYTVFVRGFRAIPVGKPPTRISGWAEARAPAAEVATPTAEAPANPTEEV